MKSLHLKLKRYVVFGDSIRNELWWEVYEHVYLGDLFFRLSEYMDDVLKENKGKL